MNLHYNFYTLSTQMVEIANVNFLISLTLALCKCKFHIYCEHSFIKRDRRHVLQLHDNPPLFLAHLPKPSKMSVYCLNAAANAKPERGNERKYTKDAMGLQ